MFDNALLDELEASIAGLEEGGEYSLTKARLTSGGLVNYNLERGAYATYPVLTPLRNEIERVNLGEQGTMKGGTAVNWKTITGVNTTNVPIGLSEGNRGGAISQTLVNNLATFVSFGLENYVTYQADWAAEGFDDAIGLAVLELMESVMIQEEYMILGGNGAQTINGSSGAVQLGTPSTPALTPATTGGVLADATYYVICVALTHYAWTRLANMGAQTGTASISQQISRSNTDGSSDLINGGISAPSVISTGATISGGTNHGSLTGSVTAVAGAVAYAWYIGTSTSHQYLQQVTSINSFSQTIALVTTTQDAQTLTATDYSNLGSYSFCGLLYQTGFNSTLSGSYLNQLATGTAGVGTALTGDGANGVTQIETALSTLYASYKMSYDTIWVSAHDKATLVKLIVGNGSAPLIRSTVNAGDPVEIMGASDVTKYLNKTTGTQLDIRVHPDMPQGTLLFTSKKVPYPHPGFGTVARMLMQRDYFQIQWPIHSLKYEYGVYAIGVLQIYFLPAFGVISNIAP